MKAVSQFAGPTANGGYDYLNHVPIYLLLSCYTETEEERNTGKTGLS
jgi:hypothetical protein